MNGQVKATTRGAQSLTDMKSAVFNAAGWVHARWQCRGAGGGGEDRKIVATTAAGRPGGRPRQPPHDLNQNNWFALTLNH
jgi:hypothetical protein